MTSLSANPAESVFSFGELLQIARSKCELRTAAHTLAYKQGETDGVVLLLCATAAIIDEMYDCHAEFDTQVRIATILRAEVKERAAAT